MPRSHRCARGLARAPHAAADRRRHPCLLLAILLLAAFAWPAHIGAQDVASPPDEQGFSLEFTPEDSLAGADLRVALLTMGPGRAVWELFGHNALLIENTRTGERVAYNWGLFDFADEDFYPNFIRGAMRYWMAPLDADRMIAAYVRDGRDVYEQELNLTPAQRARLQRFVSWNARPENAYYRYDYFLDNCSTRVRDAIDLALDGALRVTLDTHPTGTTFRWHARRLTQVQPWTYVGIEAGLASPTDVPISAWAESFLPMRLREHVRLVQVTDANGTPQPLVLSERVLSDGPMPPEPERPPTWWPYFLVAGLAIAASIVLLARAVLDGSRRAAAWLAGVGAGWSTVAGFAGALLLFLWFGTAHTATHGNWNVLQFNPLSLPLVVLVPRLVRAGRAAGITRALSLAVAALSVVGAALLPIPLQYTAEMVALALPAHLALAWAMSRLEARRARAA